MIMSGLYFIIPATTSLYTTKSKKTKHKKLNKQSQILGDGEKLSIKHRSTFIKVFWNYTSNRKTPHWSLNILHRGPIQQPD